jgi:hypothetical protein
MQGIEKAYCDVCVKAVIAANRTLMETSATEALNRDRYGKVDTLGFDAIPEILIQKRIQEFDSHALLVTEELSEVTKLRWPTDSNPVKQPLMFFSDPMDRSRMLKKFIESISADKPYEKIGALFAAIDVQKKWEEMFEPPASITGATISITCVRKGEIVFSVILNCITNTILVACPLGVYHLSLPQYTNADLESVNLDQIVEKGKRLKFPPAKDGCRNSDDYKRFVTFLGKSGYLENLQDCMIFIDNPENFLHHREPGGPARILYLSEFQSGYGPIGFIMANGEKIGEWMPWLGFVKFANNQDGNRKLLIFEIFINRPYIKDDILMSTSPAYSLFQSEEEHFILDISRLRNFAFPSMFRSMLVVTAADNERIIHIMRQHGYREIIL